MGELLPSNREFVLVAKGRSLGVTPVASVLFIGLNWADLCARLIYHHWCWYFLTVFIRVESYFNTVTLVSCNNFQLLSL